MAVVPVTAVTTDITGTNQPRQPDIGGTPEVTEAPKEDLLSPKYAELARKEKALVRKFQAREQEFKAREEALKAKEAEYQTSYVPKKSLTERFQKDPLGLAGEYGVGYDQIVQAALNQPDPVNQKLIARIEELEGRLNQGVTNQEKQQKDAYDQAVNQIRNDTKLLVDGNESFETIKETNSVDAVVELIEETFKQEGILLTVEDAAKQVEDYLVEEAFKMAQLKKVKLRLSPPLSEETALKPQPEIPQKQPMKTLTNAVSASSKPLNANDRRQRAILAFQGKLTN